MFYLVDTGILLRLFDRSDPQSTIIRQALPALLLIGEELCTTVQNVAEFWNVWTRPTSARGGYGQSPSSARRRVRLIERFGPILPETNDSYSKWKDLASTHNIIGVSVHDARLVAVMETANVTHLITLNPDDFRRYPGITVLTPEDVLDQDNSATGQP